MAVSTGKVDITPAVGSYLAGYGTRVGPRISVGVGALPLHARCTVFWDDGWPNVLVSVDVLGIGEAMNRQIRSRLSGLVPSQDLILTATHTHSGPVLPQRLHPQIAYDISETAPVDAYGRWLTDAIVALVKETLAGPRTPCTLDYQVADENLGYNRDGLPYVERDVPILVARSGSGAPIAVLFGWGCHPVTVPDSVFDPDYPGEAVSWIEDTTGAFAQFVLGAAGDQDPVRGATTAQIGEDLGKTVISAVATPGRPIQGPLKTAYSRANLPLDITDEPANLQAVRDAYEERATTNRQGHEPWFARHAIHMMRQIDTRTFATVVPLPVQVWSFSGGTPLRIALTGGELFSGYAVYLRQRYGGSDGIWVGGYANELLAYIPSDELLASGAADSYPGGWNHDYPGIAGGSMTVYAWLGHFLGRRPGTSTVGVEQTLIAKLTSML
jgi:hypothetical protein